MAEHPPPPPPSTSAAPLARVAMAVGPRERTQHLPGGVRMFTSDGAVVLTWRSWTATLGGLALALTTGACIGVIGLAPIALCLVPLALAGLVLASLSSAIAVGDAAQPQQQLLLQWGPLSLLTELQIAVADIRSVEQRSRGVEPRSTCDVVITLVDGSEHVLAARVSSTTAESIVTALSR